MNKAPFAIEEDGFGNFRLFAKVFFLDLFVDLHYDITLLDKHESYSFRTVRLDPKCSDEWLRFSKYGGVSFICSLLIINAEIPLLSIFFPLLQ